MRPYTLRCSTEVTKKRSPDDEQQQKEHNYAVIHKSAAKISAMTRATVKRTKIHEHLCVQKELRMRLKGDSGAAMTRINKKDTNTQAHKHMRICTHTQMGAKMNAGRILRLAQPNPLLWLIDNILWFVICDTMKSELKMINYSLIHLTV